LLRLALEEILDMPRGTCMQCGKVATHAFGTVCVEHTPQGYNEGLVDIPLNELTIPPLSDEQRYAWIMQILDAGGTVEFSPNYWRR
jgi:hypothetical protein